MSYDIDIIYDLYSMNYKEVRGNQSYAEFTITDSPYISLRPALIENTIITSLLPIEGLQIPFDSINGELVFEDKWYGWLVSIKQESDAINGSIISNFIGNNLSLKEYRYNSVLDGGHITIENSGDIYLSPGILKTNKSLYDFCGLYWPLSNDILILPKGRGLSICVFCVIEEGHYKKGKPIQIETIKTDLIVDQIGDYSTLYGAIKSLHGVYFNNKNYVELYRAQLISQSPSTPYINGHIDMRMRKPTIENYPGIH